MTTLLSIIKKIIMEPSKQIFHIPLQVDSYSKVIDLWKKYKKYKNIDLNDVNQNYILNNLFDFHLSEINHVLLYYSCNLDHCLMMCKANNKYINISVPIQKNLIKKDINFIAIYCGGFAPHTPH